MPSRGRWELKAQHVRAALCRVEGLCLGMCCSQVKVFFVVVGVDLKDIWKENQASLFFYAL